MNIVGVRLAAAVGGVLTVVKLVALAGIIGLGLALGHGGRPAVATTEGAGMGAAMIGVLWSYGGWQHASFAAGEAKRAGRDVPLGMIVGTAIITLVYVLATVAYLRLLPLDVLIASPHVASDAVQAAIGPAGRVPARRHFCTRRSRTSTAGSTSTIPTWRA